MNGLIRSARSGLTALTIAAGVVLAGGQTGHAASGAPFQDPNAKGAIGFCDRSGQAITSGSINTTPFVWRGISTQAALPPYNAPGRTATLYAFQPRKGIPAALWSGEQLTASARYTNAAHPMTAATTSDESLKQFIQDYPPSWDGLVELRMFLGVPDHPTNSASYAATDIRVTGSTWQVVQGGTVPCNSGQAVSIETILKPTTSPSAHPKAHASGTGDHHHKASTAGGNNTSGNGGAAKVDPSNAASQSAVGSSGQDYGSVVLLIVIIAFVLAIGYVLFRWWRNRTSSGPPSSLHRTF